MFYQRLIATKLAAPRFARPQRHGSKVEQGRRLALNVGDMQVEADTSDEFARLLERVVVP
jgi:hypothetical protein